MQTTATNPWVLDTICYCVGGLVVLLGMVFALRALVGDRAKGQRRCQKCWYDMTGLEGLRCPECGKVARDEAALTRTRRRWRAAVLWLVIGILGVGAILTPRVSRQGPIGAVPTTVLVWASPCERGPMGSPAMVAAARLVPGPRLGTAFPPEPTWGERAEMEVWRRVMAGEAWTWQARALIDRWLASQKLSLDGLVDVPNAWREGEPLPLLVRRSQAKGGLGAIGFGEPPAQQSSFYSLGPVGKYDVYHSHTPTTVVAKDGTRRTRVVEPVWASILGVPLAIGTLEMSTDALAPEVPLLESVDEPEITELMRRALDPRVVVDAYGKDVVLGDRSDAEFWKAIKYEVRVEVRVMMDGRRVGVGEAGVNTDYAVWKDYTEAKMNWEPGGLEAVLAAPQKATLRVIGRLELAERVHMREWPDSNRTRAWTGSFEVPVRVDAVRTRER